MNIEDSKVVIKILQTSFRSSLREDDIYAWIDFFKNQDFLVAKKVADDFRDHSAEGWLPSIADFSIKIRNAQVAISQNEALRRDSSSCSECKGLTWSVSDPSGLIPCSQCRSSSFAKWRDSEYIPGAIIDEDDRNGVQKPHQIASLVMYKNGPAVSEDRSKQWTAHLLSNEFSVYPEGDFPIVNKTLEDVVQDKEAKHKEALDEF